MSRVRNDIPLVPSLLDRLIDNEPSARQETPRSRNQTLREMIASVRRDLEYLLNTRWRCLGWSSDLEELEQSLVNYGIPDVLGADLGSEIERLAFRKSVERAVCIFEPRLDSVNIQFQDAAETADRTLRFRIEAMLRVEPAPEPVVFDSTLELSTGNVEVRGRNR